MPRGRRDHPLQPTHNPLSAHEQECALRDLVLYVLPLLAVLTACPSDAGGPQAARDSARYGRPTVFARGEGEQRLMRGAAGRFSS